MKTYATRTQALRALRNIGDEALKNAKKLIVETEDGTFSFDEDLAELAQYEGVVGIEESEEVLPTAKIAPIGKEVEGDPHDYQCPHCGIDLMNGVGGHGDDYTDGKGRVRYIKHDKFEYRCLACEGEFGTSIHKTIKTKEGSNRAKSETQSNTMRSSIKLNRTIACIDTGGTWKNAHQMYKNNPSWMSSGQQDRLTAALYAAAKKGEKITVEVNSRRFQLVEV